MARTEELIRREIATMQNVRFEAKGDNLKQMAHEQIMKLRAELAMVKGLREREKSDLPKSHNGIAELDGLLTEIKEEATKWAAEGWKSRD